MHRLICLLAAAIAGAGPAAALSFLSAIDDMPLMDGLVETDAQTVFETPFGRIIEAEASGDADPDAIARFYAETLPALGWRAVEGDDAYERGDERLQILVTDTGQTVNARFRLIARPASSRMTP